MYEHRGYFYRTEFRSHTFRSIAGIASIVCRRRLPSILSMCGRLANKHEDTTQQDIATQLLKPGERARKPDPQDAQFLGVTTPQLVQRGCYSIRPIIQEDEEVVKIERLTAAIDYRFAETIPKSLSVTQTGQFD